MMKVVFIFLFTFYISFAKCSGVDSYETNVVELTPLHDAIIFNDIADIISEFENSMNSQFNNHMFSNSESDDDVENLLSEYQQYLDKAHEQRLNYIKKTKSKNKVPLLRHEKFTKLKPIKNHLYDNANYYFDDAKHPTASLVNTFIPQNSNIRIAKKNEDIFDFLKSSRDDKNIIHLPPLFAPIPSDTMLSSCYCKENIIPCKCGCKQCLIVDNTFPTNFNKMETERNLFNDDIFKTKYVSENNQNILDSNLNIRIKIDVQLPNITMLGNIIKHRNQEGTGEHERNVPKENFKTINLPFPYLNFPIPMELIGYKQNLFKEDSSPVHKITIHKKKKYRLGNNKKHRNKKLFYLHNSKSEPQTQQNIIIENKNNSEAIKNNFLYINEVTSLHKNASQKIERKPNQSEHTDNKNTTIANQNNNSNNESFQTIYLTVNITKGNNNHTEELPKIENSIETDIDVSVKDNVTTPEPLRLKREIIKHITKTVTLTMTNNLTNINKSFDKDSITDNELLYWPSSINNQSLIQSKNITAIILDREIKKAKLNMSRDKIRNNHTTALEKAIFGDVDWNDVDAVVPAFMSFIGKYIRGVLTFCSQNLCHSMKCAEKICSHRICRPENRYNHKGHCVGNNETDSVASMESIMDLPSNIAFEVVDILQEKMLGKLFGKVTLCINSKCNAFAAYKKRFHKSKCSFKELNSTGHCPNLKNVKII